jgi:hypothetical protein
MGVFCFTLTYAFCQLNYFTGNLAVLVPFSRFFFPADLQRGLDFALMTFEEGSDILVGFKQAFPVAPLRRARLVRARGIHY